MKTGEQYGVAWMNGPVLKKFDVMAVFNNFEQKENE